MGGRTRGSFAAAVAVVQLVGAAATAASPTVRLRTCLGEPATHVGTAGDDRIVGTSGRDVIVGRGGSDFIRGGDGRDRICGGSGYDALDGRYGDDFVSGGGDGDRIFGGPGDDLLLGGPGLDEIEGGDGAGSDTLVGGPDGDFMKGGDGRSDQDFLFGGGGNDSLDGGIGGHDELYPGPGDDFLSNGLVSYEFSAERVVVDLTTTADREVFGEGSDNLIAPDGIVGSNFDDWIFGDEGSHSFSGRAGDDVISAGDGDDSVDGGRGSDDLDGGGGRDFVRFEESPAEVTVSLAQGSARGAGDDSLVGFENVEGSFFDDQITGDEGPNELEGSFGTNTVFALGGDDRLRDVAFGHAGDGLDSCFDAPLDGCEAGGFSDRFPFPSVESPSHLEEVDRLGTIGGAIGGGLGIPDQDGVLVQVRRMTADGCWWWDARAGRFARAGCGTGIGNIARWSAGNEWSLQIDEDLLPGRYRIRVDWPDPDIGSFCGGLYEPMCVELDVR